MDDQAQMRKVELGSPEDMRYIIKNIQAAAKKKTDLHIPPVQAKGDDLLRKRVDELVDDVRISLPFPFCLSHQSRGGFFFLLLRACRRQCSTGITLTSELGKKTVRSQDVRPLRAKH
jgi:hypothetical protein